MKKIAFLGCSVIFHIGLLVFIKIILPYKYQPNMQPVSVIFLSPSNKIIAHQSLQNLQPYTHLKATQNVSHAIGQATQNNMSEIAQASVSNIYPSYPEIARKKGIEADFDVLLVVTADGSVDQININEHPYLTVFKSSIEKALYTWKFSESHSNQLRLLNQQIVFRLS